MTTVITYTIYDGSIERLTPAQTKEWILFGLREFEAVCDVQFRAKLRGRVRFEFRPESEQNHEALDNTYANGDIFLASVTAKDRWKMHLPDRYVLPNVVVHAIAAHLSPFNLGHNDDPDSVFGPTATSYLFSPDDVLRLQKVVGPPKNVFRPFSRYVLGQQSIKATEAWKQAAKDRADFIASIPNLNRDIWTDKAIKDAVVYFNETVKANLDKATQASERWWRVNNAWTKVPMAMTTQPKPK